MSLHWKGFVSVFVFCFFLPWILLDSWLGGGGYIMASEFLSLYWGGEQGWSLPWASPLGMCALILFRRWVWEGHPTLSRRGLIRFFSWLGPKELSSHGPEHLPPSCPLFLVSSCPFRVSQSGGTGHANPTFKLQTPQGKRKVRALHHWTWLISFDLC